MRAICVNANVEPPEGIMESSLIVVSRNVQNEWSSRY